MIRRRVIQLMVTVSTSALHKKADLMLKILEHVCLTIPLTHLVVQITVGLTNRLYYRHCLLGRRSIRQIMRTPMLSRN